MKKIMGEGQSNFGELTGIKIENPAEVNMEGNGTEYG